VEHVRALAAMIVANIVTFSPEAAAAVSRHGPLLTELQGACTLNPNTGNRN
jgi:hypothetical protein